MLTIFSRQLFFGYFFIFCIIQNVLNQLAGSEVQIVTFNQWGIEVVGFFNSFAADSNIKTTEIT